MKGVPATNARGRLPPLLNLPFVGSDGIFINPKYRGTRLSPEAMSTPEEWHGMFLRKPIRVHDARAREHAPSLSGQGFQLFDAPVRVDFGNPTEVDTRFHEYCADLVIAATGCLAAKVVQHEFRTGHQVGPPRRGNYSRIVHTDLCPWVEDVVDMPPEFRGHHFGMFTLWRGIDPEREIDYLPLACCDTATVATTDIVYADVRRRTEPPTRTIQCNLIHDAGQCWYYFPRMTPDETLVFQLYDTRQEAANLRGTFHTTFVDPTTPEDAPLRQSIDARVLAIFEARDLERDARRARFRAQVPDVRPGGSVSTWSIERMVDWEVDWDTACFQRGKTFNPA